jgi:hypothetical protein
MQDFGDLVYPLTVAFLIGMVIAVAWVLYILGSLPGRIANDRGHPHATAIGVCGWLGLPTFVLWSVALMWAYLTPRDHKLILRRQRKLNRPLNDDEVNALAANLRNASEEIAAIKIGLAALPPSKRIA